MRRFHFAHAAILARVTGLGKNVVALFRLWTCGGGLGARTTFTDCDLECRGFRRDREFGLGCFIFHSPEHHLTTVRRPWGVTLPNFLTPKSEAGDGGGTMSPCRRAPVPGRGN